MIKIIKNEIAKRIITWLKYFKKNIKYNFFIRSINNNIVLPKRTFSDSNNHVFFGYYDISPFNINESILLALHVPIDKFDQYAKFGYYNLNEDNPIFHEVGKTNTWCWQQGCRLQWFPRNSGSSILYNTIVDGQYGSQVCDIYKKKILKTFNRPIYTVSNNGECGLSLNFSRLQRLRPGYGYSTLPDETNGNLVPNEDGIWRVDMRTGKSKFLFSINDIVTKFPGKKMDGAEHYFNHLLFNQDSIRFSFIHIWIYNGKRYNRLLSSDYDGKDIFILNNEGYSSHYCWKSPSKILSFAGHKPFGKKFYLYDDKTKNRKIIGRAKLNQDGHPSFFSNSELLLVDTYPDLYQNQFLLLYHLNDNKLILLEKFYTPSIFSGEIRCDLHPRLSPNEVYACVDNIENNKRVMTIFDLKSQMIDIFQ